MSNEKKYLDYEGLQYLWSKISMEDYPNNEMLITVINAIDENLSQKQPIGDYVLSTDIIPIEYGGTNATTISGARTNLGLQTEQWTFTLDNGSTVTKKVVVIP